ncbi:hypothetical protein JW756_04830 [Candidatus Woesearchaeota archaeon]|nr:hypothetical protein [Candidatus Woesearchaeota archaeon]
MGLLDRLRGKKSDELGLDNLGPDLGSMPDMNAPLGSPDPNFGMPPPDMQQPMGGPMPMDMQQQGPPGNFSPESMGFERVQQNGLQGSQGYPQPQQNLNEINMGKDLEIISAKLDAIKAELDSMSQRMKRLERMAEGEGSSFKDKWNY